MWTDVDCWVVITGRLRMCQEWQSWSTKLCLLLLVNYTVKINRINTDIQWRVFRILTELVLYTFVSVNRRNNEARAHVAMWASASLFRRITNVYGTGSVRIPKTRHWISVDIRIFLQFNVRRWNAKRSSAVVCLPVAYQALHAPAQYPSDRDRRLHVHIGRVDVNWQRAQSANAWLAIAHDKWPPLWHTTSATLHATEYGRRTDCSRTIIAVHNAPYCMRFASRRAAKNKPRTVCCAVNSVGSSLAKQHTENWTDAVWSFVCDQYNLWSWQFSNNF